MNPVPRAVLCILASLTLAGCEGYQNGVESFGHGLGMIETQDIQSANAYGKVLPDQLGLLPRQVDVQPGSGVVHVAIYGVADDAARQTIAVKLAAMNAQNPQLDPMQWSFDK